jgi:hypothetical protein
MSAKLGNAGSLAPTSFLRSVSNPLGETNFGGGSETKAGAAG